MGPLLRLVLVVFAFWLLIRYIKHILDPKPTSRRPPADTAKLDNVMLPCKYCGVYLPQSEIIQRGGDAYCSQEHAEADS